ncbi:MAG: transcriptional regulator, partial [Pseudaminobacter sp.]|nr:transcriptional regulator [Pseudaminobacter sp.]
EELSIRARLLEEGGPALWEEFMAELRGEHLATAPGAPKPEAAVRARLQAAYEAVMERKRGETEAA